MEVNPMNIPFEDVSLACLLPWYFHAWRFYFQRVFSLCKSAFLYAVVNLITTATFMKGLNGITMYTRFARNVCITGSQSCLV